MRNHSNNNPNYNNNVSLLLRNRIEVEVEEKWFSPTCDIFLILGHVAEKPLTHF